MTPIWTTIFEILFLKKRPGVERLLTLLLALGGLWIVFSKQTFFPLPENSGDWLAFAGGAIFANIAPPANANQSPEFSGNGKKVCLLKTIHKPPRAKSKVNNLSTPGLFFRNKISNIVVQIGVI